MNRTCLSCKHFERSTVWKRGWCRNTLLYAPAQSHLVDEDGLDCRRGTHDFWEAAESGDRESSAEAGQATVKMPKSSPLQLFAGLRRQPARPDVDELATLANPRDELGLDGLRPVSGGADTPDDVETPATRGHRGDQGNVPAGRQRTVHFQPEDRYWTDYLRIALPVIGLVLMLGLFWYWASTFIGNPESTEPGSSQSPGQAVIDEPPASPTAEATQAAVVRTPVVNTGAANTAATETPVPEPTNTPATANTTTGGDNTAGDNQAGNNQAAGNQEATEPASSGGEFADGDQVTVSADVLNLRDAPSTDGAQITQLAKGDKLTITAGPEQGDSFTWYQVQTSDGTQGWVASAFLQK